MWELRPKGIADVTHLLSLLTGKHGVNLGPELRSTP